MFDGFEFKPQLDIVSAEFTFNRFSAAVAIHLVGDLKDTLRYGKFSKVCWVVGENEYSTVLRAHHDDEPVTVDLGLLELFWEKLGDEAVSIVDSYNARNMTTITLTDVSFNVEF